MYDFEDPYKRLQEALRDVELILSRLGSIIHGLQETVASMRITSVRAVTTAHEAESVVALAGQKSEEQP